MQNGSMHDAGGWLAAAGILLIAALFLHPPPETETGAFLEQIAHEGDHWVLAHWLGAGAFTLFVVAGLMAVTSGTTAGVTRGAWGLVIVGALATLVTAVAEATVVSGAAADGDLATFAAWERFAAGMSMGFAVMGLGVALIAGGTARTSIIPRWSAVAASAVAAVSSGAWILGAGLGVAWAPPVWLVSALVMTAWLVWYGLALTRTGYARPTREATHA